MTLTTKQQNRLTTHEVYVVDTSGSIQSILDVCQNILDKELKAAAENGNKVSIVDVSTNASIKVECSEAVLPYTITPDGYTALIDGMHLGAFLAAKYLGDFDRTLMVTITDGGENTSKQATWELVNNMIESLDKTDKFTAAFFGSVEGMRDIKSKVTAIPVANTYQWNPRDPISTQMMAQNVGASATGYRMGNSTVVRDYVNAG